MNLTYDIEYFSSFDARRAYASIRLLGRGAISRFIRPPQRQHIAPMGVGVKFCVEESTKGQFLHAKFHPPPIGTRWGVGVWDLKNGKFYEIWEHKCLRDSCKIFKICGQFRARSIFYSAPQCSQCSHCKRCTSYNNSVRLSVCLPVTRRYCVKTTARSTVQFALSDSRMCLVL